MKNIVILFVFVCSPVMAADIPTVTGEPPHMVARPDGTGYQPDVDFKKFYEMVEPGSDEDVWAVSGGE